MRGSGQPGTGANSSGTRTASSFVTLAPSNFGKVEQYTLRLARGARPRNLIIIESGRMPRRKPYDQQALGWVTTHAEHRKWESKRERPIKNSGPALFSGVDWPALFFWALVVAFVLWPTVQWTLRYWLCD